MPASEETAVEAVQGVVAALEFFKLDIDLAFVTFVVRNGAVNNLAIAVGAFGLEVIGKLNLPVTLLPVKC